MSAETEQLEAIFKKLLLHMESQLNSGEVTSADVRNILTVLKDNGIQATEKHLKERFNIPDLPDLKVLDGG